MSSSISLYIKRAEETITPEYVVDVFRKNDIGEVADATFIKKRDIGSGKDYYGVVVTFNRWFNTQRANALLEEISNTFGAVAKFIYNTQTNRYWWVQIHRVFVKEPEELPLEIATKVTGDTTLSDKEKIDKLVKMMQSMAIEMAHLQRNSEKTECMAMHAERKHTHNLMCHEDFLFQLELKDMELQDAQKEKREKDEEISNLKYRLEEVVRENEETKLELYESECIISLLQQQAEK